jgi:hypothetical protein
MNAIFAQQLPAQTGCLIQGQAEGAWAKSFGSGLF